MLTLRWFLLAKWMFWQLIYHFQVRTVNIIHRSQTDEHVFVSQSFSSQLRHSHFAQAIFKLTAHTPHSYSCKTIKPLFLSRVLSRCHFSWQQFGAHELMALKSDVGCIYELMLLSIRDHVVKNMLKRFQWCVNNVNNVTSKQAIQKIFAPTNRNSCALLTHFQCEIDYFSPTRTTFSHIQWIIEQIWCSHARIQPSFVSFIRVSIFFASLICWIIIKLTSFSNENFMRCSFGPPSGGFACSKVKIMHRKVAIRQKLQTDCNEIQMQRMAERIVT